MLKPDPTFEKCVGCRTLYDPGTSATECPHGSLRESPMLRRLRTAGKPYKLEPWKAGADLDDNVFTEAWR